jgi:hypothetical protein
MDKTNTNSSNPAVGGSVDMPIKAYPSKSDQSNAKDDKVGTPPGGNDAKVSEESKPEGCVKDDMVYQDAWVHGDDDDYDDDGDDYDENGEYDPYAADARVVIKRLQEKYPDQTVERKGNFVIVTMKPRVPEAMKPVETSRCAKSSPIHHQARVYDDDDEPEYLSDFNYKNGVVDWFNVPGCRQD